MSSDETRQSEIEIKSRNPFFNFLRAYRLQTKERRQIIVTRKAATKWRNLTDIQKMPFIMMARNQPKRMKRITQLKLITHQTKAKPECSVDWNSVMYVK